jgi:hypothetical protein
MYGDPDESDTPDFGGSESEEGGGSEDTPDTDDD